MPEEKPDESILSTLLPSLVEGLHTIGVISQAHTTNAQGALNVIAAIYQTLRAGLSGDLTPKAVEEALRYLKEKHASIDAKHDAALADKFDTSERG